MIEISSDTGKNPIQQGTAGAESDEVRELIIIGSGPAGYTAAVYAARAELRPVVLEGALAAGGALMTTTEVENYPGFADGVTGPELMDQMRGQAARFGAELITEDAVTVELSGAIKQVTDAAGVTYRARAVILAMGSAYRKLGVPREDELSGRGVSWCATCDGFFFKGKDLVVVGGGDSAMEEATFLTRFARSLTLVHRRGELRASRIMAIRAQHDPKIAFALRHEITELHGDDLLREVTIVDTETGAERRLDAQGLFIAIGHDPRSDLVRGQLALDAAGYVLVQGRSTRTSLEGVFAAGDLVDHTYQQAITAAGSGCAAALDAERYLADLADRGSDRTAVASATADAGVPESTPRLRVS